MIFRRLFIYISLCLAALSVVISLWIYSEYSWLQRRLSVDAADQVTLSEIEFENASSVEKTDYNFFASIWNVNGPQPEYSNLQKDIKIHLLEKNDCEHVYCLQFKTSFDQIPSNIWRSLIGIEDIRFLEHEGIDYKSILRALWADIKALKLVQGGSTITQQLVKNLFLTNEKTISRKFKEIIFASIIETKFEKEQILAAYLNEVFWGSLDGIRIKGYFSASIFYFGKHPSLLSDFESTILISMLKGPYFYSPIRHLQRLKTRTEVVFNGLLQKQLLSAEGKWTDNQWEIWQKQISQRTKLKQLSSLWYLYNNSINENAYMHWLLIKESLIKLSELKEKYPRSDFAIKIYRENLRCKNECEQFFFYSKVERDREQALSSEQHQIGSIIKPLVYEAMAELGLEWDEEVETAPVSLKLLSGNWTPTDASAAKQELVSAEYALRKSRNIPLIRFAQKVGFEEIEQLLLERIVNLKRPLKEYPSQLLGSIEMSFANLTGLYRDFFIRQCLSISRGILSEGNSTMYKLIDASETTLSYRANNYAKQHPFFGKTGTSNNSLDSWFVGFDGDVMTIIWLGDEARNKDEKYKVGGASGAFPIFQKSLIFAGKRISQFRCL